MKHEKLPFGTEVFHRKNRKEMSTALFSVCCVALFYYGLISDTLVFQQMSYYFSAERKFFEMHLKNPS
jgi:hypothetical protein